MNKMQANNEKPLPHALKKHRLMISRCVEGLHMMSSEDAEPFEALSQRNHHVRGSNYGSKTTDLPPRRRSRGRLSLGVFPWWEFMWCSLPKWSIVFLSIIVGFFILFFVRLRSLNEFEFY